jgi:hypothetical protein
LYARSRCSRTSCGCRATRYGGSCPLERATGARGHESQRVLASRERSAAGVDVPAGVRAAATNPVPGSKHDARRAAAAA